MEVQTIGSTFLGKTGKGEHRTVYQVKIGQKTGYLIFIYNFIDRDCLEETVRTTPEIAEDIKTFLGEDSIQCFDQFSIPEEPFNKEQVKTIETECTTTIYTSV